MQLYHVTDADRLERIMAEGLRARSPERMYRSSKLFATDAMGTWLWARELASARRERFRAAVIEISPEARPGWIGSTPYPGMIQHATKNDIGPEFLRVVHEFQASPDERPLWLRMRDRCPACSEPLLCSLVSPGTVLECHSIACNPDTGKLTRHLREKANLWRAWPQHDDARARRWLAEHPWAQGVPWLAEAA
jgi:hypothetical protein